MGLRSDFRTLRRGRCGLGGETRGRPEGMVAPVGKKSAVDELHCLGISRKVADFLAENAEVKEVAMAAEA